MNNKWHLKGKHALISGGSRGIGLAIAQELLELGAEILVVGRDQNRLTEQITRWKKKNYPVEGIRADVSVKSDRERLFETLTQKWDSLDFLINNAGTNIRKKVMEFSEQEYDFIFDTNLNSVFDMCRRAFPLLQKSEQASLVNISSVAGLIHRRTLWDDQSRHGATHPQSGSGVGQGGYPRQLHCPLVYSYTIGGKIIRKPLLF